MGGWYSTVLIIELFFDHSVDLDLDPWLHATIDILDFVANTNLTLCSTLHGHPQCLDGEELLEPSQERQETFRTSASYLFLHLPTACHLYVAEYL